MDKETFNKNKKEAIKKIFVRILISRMRCLFAPTKPRFFYTLEVIALHSQFTVIRHSSYIPDKEYHKIVDVQQNNKEKADE